MRQGATAPLWSWLGPEEDGGKFKVGSGVVSFNGQNRHQKYRPYTGFSFIQGVSRQRHIHSSASVSLTSLVPPLSNISVMEHNFQPICTVPHTDYSSHPRTTTATTRLDVSSYNKHIPPTRSDRFLLLPCFALSSSPLVSLVDA